MEPFLAANLGTVVAGWPTEARVGVGEGPHELVGSGAQVVRFVPGHPHLHAVGEAVLPATVAPLGRKGYGVIAGQFAPVRRDADPKHVPFGVRHGLGRRWRDPVGDAAAPASVGRGRWRAPCGGAARRLLGGRRRRHPAQARLCRRECTCVVYRILDLEQLRFAGDVRRSVPWIGMVAQPLRAARAALLLDRLEHVHHFGGVVARQRHDVGSEQVGLLLVLAAEAQERGAEAKLRALRDDAADIAANHRPQDGAEQLTDLVLGRLGGLRGTMTQGHVTQLVGHDAGRFAFGMRRFDHAAVEVHRPAGQRKRVDLAHIDDGEGVAELGMPQLGRDDRHQPLAHRHDRRRHRVVAQDRQLLFDLGGGLAAELHVLRRGVLVVGGCDHGLRADRTGRADRQQDGSRGRHG